MLYTISTNDFSNYGVHTMYPDERGEALSDSNCTLIFTMVTAHKMFVIPILNSIYTTLDFREKIRIEIKNITFLF